MENLHGPSPMPIEMEDHPYLQLNLQDPGGVPLFCLNHSVLGLCYYRIKFGFSPKDEVSFGSWSESIYGADEIMATIYHVYTLKSIYVEYGQIRTPLSKTENWDFFQCKGDHFL